MQRLTRLAPCGLILLILLISGNAGLFAQETDPDVRSSGLLSAVVWVVVWMAVFAAIGVGIYSWIGKRRNRPSHGVRRMPRFNLPSGVPTNPRRSAAPPQASQLETERGPPTPSAAQGDTPEALSLRELNQIASHHSHREFHEYYNRISSIVKRYVEQKYGVKTLDATTGEILGSLPHDLTSSVADHVGEILRTCDMIHLSGHRPSRSDLREIYRTTKEFFERQMEVSSNGNSTDDEDNLEELTKHYRRMV
ncbi:MAG: hypothetical protein OXN17_06440 [Candidatus Poribacteria bacterium]|nr:hypothetical protein [Candidatus Poribacteria bacterium]